MLRHNAALLLLLCLCFGTNVYAHTSKCAAEYWPEELNKINAHIDDTLQPCDDFYEYACGNWRVPYELRALHARDTLTALKAANKQLLMRYFEQQWDAVNRTQHLDANKRLAINFYESCLDDKAVTPKSGGLKAYSETLLGISDWPVLNANYIENNNTNASFNWQHVSAQLRHFDAQSFWRLLVQPNWQNAEQLIIYLAPPKFDELPREDVNGADADDKLFLYKHYIKYLMLDLDVRVRKASHIAEEVVDFELQLRALSGSEQDFVLREPQTLESLQRELPAVNLQIYFETLFAAAGETLRPDYAQQLLVVADKIYLQKLSNFLAKANAQTIAKYLLVQFLAHFEVHRHEHESFYEQKQECLLELHNLLPQQLTQLFLQLQHESSTQFLQQTQCELQSIFVQLKEKFEQMLNATDIFERDAVTKLLVLEKLRAMRLLLPAQALVAADDNILLTHDYHRNKLLLERLRSANELAPILQSIASTATAKTTHVEETHYGPLDVNAFYRLKKNAIELPIGILRAPIYDRCLALPKIYGGFVYIIAHELLHGFDYDGINYDKSGNVANSWGAKSIIQFGTKSSCYMAARYPNAPRNINENIADSEGLRLALETFMAGRGYIAAQRAEQLQLFFTSFAQTWCGAAVTNKTRSLHASHKGRVNNVVGNFAEFAEAFQCSDSSAMHPLDKCRIW